MDDCRRTEERLTPYVDAELPEAERTDVERHLNRCPPCHRSAVEEESGKKLVRECAGSLRHSSLPPGLRSRCEAIARDHRRGALSPWMTRLVPATLVATLVTVVAVGVFSLATRRSGTLLAAQLAADHVKCFSLFPPDGAEVDARQVERDLEQRYGWDMHVPASSAETGLQLLGGFRCLYGEGTMPHVMYRAPGAAPVSLFRLDGVTREEADVTTMGYRCRIWSRGNNTYALVTPASASPVDARLVQYVRQEAR